MMSKYSVLGAYLKRQQKNVVTLNFAEIEKIIGAGLPQSALRYREWWANNAKGHSQARSWLGAGYQVVGVQQGRSGSVIFRRAGTGFWERLMHGN